MPIFSKIPTPIIVVTINKMADEIAKTILKCIPKDGTFVTNKAVREKARLDKSIYIIARKRLLQEGVIGRARGMGGRVYRLGAPPPPKDPKKPGKKLESALYAPVEEVLREAWTAENSITDFIIQTTANQGSKKTGGKWTRPDIVVVAVQRFKYVPGTVLTLATFEIKAEGRWGIESVYETAAHSTFAHKSYLAIHAPKLSLVAESPDFERLIDHAERFDIGVMVFEHPSDWDTYEVVLEADRREPDPVDVDDFLQTQLDKANKSDLLKKLELSFALRPPS